MNAIRNWLLPILLTLGGILDFGFDLITQFASVLHIPSNIVDWIRIIIVIIGAVILKLQAPTTDPVKLQELVARAKKLKKPEEE
jgi:hypothetical protein